MVKFEEDLQSECLVNWSNEYLDYKSLKSILVFEKEEIKIKLPPRIQDNYKIKLKVI